MNHSVSRGNILFFNWWTNLPGQSLLNNMEDIKFASAFEIDWPYFSKIAKAHKDCIAEVANVYSKNMLLVRSLIELLPLFSGIVTRYSRAAESLMQEFQLEGNPFSTEGLDPATRQRFHDRVEEITNQEEAALRQDPNKAVKYDQMQIRNVVYFLLLYQGDPLESGIRALLQATIKDAWTAIEVLAEDLLTCVMREFPSCFQKVIWEKNQPRFRSRALIREAYEKAFPVDNAGIKSALSSAGIDALALLRNVLVHRGGMADKEFKEGAECNPLLMAFGNHEDGDEVKIDGELIKSVIEPAAKAGCDLLVAVDTWITMACP